MSTDTNCLTRFPIGVSAAATAFLSLFERISLRSASWSVTQRDPASSSQVLGVKTCITTPALGLICCFLSLPVLEWTRNLLLGFTLVAKLPYRACLCLHAWYLAHADFQENIRLLSPSALRGNTETSLIWS